MNLRLRLVAGLVALLTVGLVVFGVATYGVYARAQYERLDEELVELSQPVGEGLLTAFSESRRLDPRQGFDRRDDRDDRTDRGRLPGPSSYVAQLRDADTGLVVGESLEPVDTGDRPDLPDELAWHGEDRWLDVGSVGDGDTRWRVLVRPVFEVDRRGPFQIVDPDPAYLVVVATPLTGVRASLARLAAIELVAASVLLVVLAVGAWLVVRRGLRPLEQMAATASTVTAGHLGARVAPADDRTEVGQLGLALNTMLSRLEGAFAEREATEQRLRRFLADASHELRTPLTSIQGYAELFRLGAGQDEADREVALARIEVEAARMRHLVDDLLLLARLDQTRPLERAPVDLAVVAADACTDAVAVDADRSVTLDAPAPAVVEGDDDHLRQAVANLVGNALRHTPPGTPIEVGVARDEAAGEAVVTVRDHGPGLDEDALAHAFDRFWQADPSRARAGAGLGLPIVAAIAAEHGGRVTAGNAAPGAVFTLRLPLAPTGPTGTATPTAPAGPTGPTGPTTPAGGDGD
ncbi:MAG TPA: ATP-binding protein [Acidimicrobiales bacterium]